MKIQLCIKFVAACSGLQYDVVCLFCTELIDNSPVRQVFVRGISSFSLKFSPSVLYIFKLRLVTSFAFFPENVVLLFIGVCATMYNLCIYSVLFLKIRRVFSDPFKDVFIYN